MSATKQKGANNKKTRKKVEALLDKGMMQQDIAKELGIKDATISYHASRIKMDKITSIRKDIEPPEGVSKKILSETDINFVLPKVKWYFFI